MGNSVSPNSSQFPQEATVPELRTHRVSASSDPFGQAANEGAPAGSGLAWSLLAHSLHRRWLPATLLGLLAAAGAAGYVWYVFVPTYRAAGWIQVSARPEALAFDQQARENKLELQTLVELMRSPAVLDEAAAQPEIRSRGLNAGHLSQGLGIEQRNESELFRVTFDSSDPETAAVAVNTIIEVHSQVQATSAQGRIQQVISLLEKDSQRRADTLAELHTRMRLLVAAEPELAALIEERNKGVDPTQALQDRLIETEVNLEVLRAQVATDRDSLDKEQGVELPTTLVNRAVDDDPQVQRLREELAAKETTLSQARAVSTQGDQAPLVRQLEAEIKHFREKLAQLRAERRPEVIKQLQEDSRIEQMEQFASAESQLARLDALQNRLQHQLADQLDQSYHGNPRLAEFENLRSEIARTEAVHAQIGQRIETLRTEVRAPGRITTIRTAKVPAEPVIKNPYVKMATAGTFAFLAPFALLIFFDQRSHRVVEAGQVHRDVGLTVVGEVAKLPPPTRNGSNRFERERKVHAESIDAVCTRLLLTPELRNVQVMATASAVSGEGKTHLASHLAVSLARSFGDRTLIVDADLRSPGIAEIFEISNERGLADVLAGKCQLEEAVVTSWSPSLHVLPAGNLSGNPHALFRSQAFEMMMRELRDRYRYVIIDVPPVLAASESLIVAEAADAALVCAMRDVSRTTVMRMAYDHLVEAGANPMGVVINGVPPRRYENRYGTYYYTRHRNAGEAPNGSAAALQQRSAEALSTSDTS